MSRQKHYNEHTLYVTSGVAREEQLRLSLNQAIQTAEINYNYENLMDYLIALKLNPTIDTELPKRDQIDTIIEYLKSENKELPPKKLFPCDIKINLIVNKYGEYFGFGYIWLSNPEVYHMLLGKNPDGSDRIKEYLDPNWIPPFPAPKMTEEERSHMFKTMSWFEITIEEEKYIHPTITEYLNPLTTIPGYRYNDEQYNHLREMAVREGTEPNDVPTMGYFEVSRAYTRTVDDGKMSNVLCARQVPSWVPPQDFKEHFTYCADDSRVKIKRKISGSDNHVYDTYPFVDLIDSKDPRYKTAFVTFDPETRDAAFSLLMNRKVTMYPDDPEKKHVLIFDHAFENSQPKNNRVNHNNRDMKPVNNNNNNNNNNRDNRKKKRYNRNCSRNDNRNGNNRDNMDITK